MFEDHISLKCPRKANNPQFQSCSLCGANDHHYISCNAPSTYVDACIAEATTMLKHSDVQPDEI